ncbi:MAG: pentapeptide repeat-containing protein, partial [Candidatus Brocadiaceae bacterium]|nr:pentapeptide repeat-containing protein [Candidatus Brocadiaceae bacterium]
LREVSFSGTWWRACQFEQEDYFFVRFPSSVFIDTQFVDCRLQKAIFRGATFIRCRFENCKLDDAVFHKARLIDTQWIDTDIRQAATLEEVRYD